MYICIKLLYIAVPKIWRDFQRYLLYLQRFYKQNVQRKVFGLDHGIVKINQQSWEYIK